MSNEKLIFYLENSTLPVAETERRTIPIGGIEHSSTKNLLLKMKASEEEFYSRPSKIKNLSLIRLKTNELNEKVFQVSIDSKILQIKHDIQNMYDYVKVDRECWEYFKAWYGYDYEIKIENNFEFVDDNSFDSLDSI